MLELDFMVLCAGGDQDVGGGNRDTRGTRATRQIKGSTPNRVVDGEFREEQPFEVLEHLLITIATGAIP